MCMVHSVHRYMYMYMIAKGKFLRLKAWSTVSALESVCGGNPLLDVVALRLVAATTWAAIAFSDERELSRPVLSVEMAGELCVL